MASTNTRVTTCSDLWHGTITRSTTHSVLGADGDAADRGTEGDRRVTAASPAVVRFRAARPGSVGGRLRCSRPAWQERPPSSPDSPSRQGLARGGTQSCPDPARLLDLWSCRAHYVPPRRYDTRSRGRPSRPRNPEQLVQPRAHLVRVVRGVQYRLGQQRHCPDRVFNPRFGCRATEPGTADPYYRSVDQRHRLSPAVHLLTNPG